MFFHILLVATVPLVTKLPLLVKNIFTPTNGQDDSDASFLFESISQKSVQIVPFTKHPSVIGESKVLGQHHEKLAPVSVLKQILRS